VSRHVRETGKLFGIVEAMKLMNEIESTPPAKSFDLRRKNGHRLIRAALLFGIRRAGRVPARHIMFPEIQCQSRRSPGSFAPQRIGISTVRFIPEADP